MNLRTLASIVAKLLAAGMLFWALGGAATQHTSHSAAHRRAARAPAHATSAGHGYDYYVLLRWIVCGVATFAAIRAFRFKKEGWGWALTIAALFFNPILPIHLNRETWAFIDVSVAVLLLVSIIAVDLHPPSTPPRDREAIDSGKGRLTDLAPTRTTKGEIMAEEEPPPKQGEIRLVNPQELHDGPVRHSDLGPLLTLWASNLFDRIGHHLYPTFEQWELGFLRDAQPQSEMVVWEAIARAFAAYLSGHPDCDKAAVASDVAMISMGIAPKGKSGATEELSEIYLRIWKRMPHDADALWNEVRRSWGKDAADD